MVKSMTGYGRGECMRHDWKFAVEIKTVNHRYCDISIRLPQVMNPYEDRIRKILASGINRGKVDVYIRMETLGHPPVKINVNTAVADAYASALHKLLDRYPVPDQITLSMLAAGPNVFTVDSSMSTADEEEMRSKAWEALEIALRAAADQLEEMRLSEGKALQADISVRRSRLTEVIDEIKTRLPIVQQDYENRLRERVEEVLAHLPNGEPDESRLIVELALFADRCNIEEELIRLESHLKQLNHILDEDDAVGRKLDFLVQELNREANTIGSKANDITVSQLVIDLKSEIEKIREQVQNVE